MLQFCRLTIYTWQQQQNKQLPTNIVMSYFAAYSLKIKIISIHFKIRAINDLIQFQLYLGQKLIDLKEIAINHGLIVNSATLQCQISDKDLQSHTSMQIVLIEKHKTHQQKLGNIDIAFQEFKNIKMRKFNIQNCFDKSAYLEAFLLLLPTRQVDQSLNVDDQVTTNQLLQNKLEKILSINSIVDINIQEEKSENEQREQCREEERIQREGQDYEMTFNVSERFNTNVSERPDVNSLITLNQILNETNNQLVIQNKNLKQSLQKMEEKYRMQTQAFDNVQKSHKDKINELQLRLKQKQCDIKKRCEQFEKLQIENGIFQKQIAQLRSSIKSQIKEQLKIDSLILQLGKYSDTANRYRSKTGSQKRKSEIKLTPMPKIPIITLTKENFFKQGVRTSRSIKESSKSITVAKQKEGAKHDETLDTMKEASSVFIPK